VVITGAAFSTVTIDVRYIPGSRIFVAEAIPPVDAVGIHLIFTRIGHISKSRRENRALVYRRIACKIDERGVSLGYCPNTLRPDYGM
jgi:hypothetical protein